MKKLSSLLILSLVLIGCSDKTPEPETIVVTKVIERNISIPNYLFDTPQVFPMKYDINGTDSYQDGVLLVKTIKGFQKHLIDLQTAYKQCTKQLNYIKELYGERE